MFEHKFIDAIRAAFPAFSGNICRETTAAEVPGWDSFGHVQLVFELEDAYGIQIDAAVSLQCENVGSLYDMVKGKESE